MTGSGKAAAGQSGNSSTTDATVAKTAAAAARSRIQQEILQNSSLVSFRTGNIMSQADLSEFWQLLQLRQGWLPPEKSHDYTDSKTAMADVMGDYTETYVCHTLVRQACTQAARLM